MPNIVYIYQMISERHRLWDLKYILIYFIMGDNALEKYTIE